MVGAVSSQLVSVPDAATAHAVVDGVIIVFGVVLALYFIVRRSADDAVMLNLHHPRGGLSLMF